MLTEQTEQFIEVLPNGVIQIRNDRVIMDNGLVVARKHLRNTFDVGADVSGQSQRIRDICALVWTPQVIAARTAEKAANAQGIPVG